MKSAAVTIRIPKVLKNRIQERARRERRSVSAQIEMELSRTFADAPPMSSTPGSFLGRLVSRKVPSDADFALVRARLWRRLQADRSR